MDSNSNTKQADSGSSLDDLLTALQQGVQAINNLTVAITATSTSS